MEEEVCNAYEISEALSIREREVYDHLTHIQKTVAARGKKLELTPYRCMGCNFEFKKRTRLDRPGKCPSCKESHIAMATYWIR